MPQSNIHKYSLAMVTMHWLTTLLIAFAIYSGTFQMPSIPRELSDGVANPASLSALWWHILAAISIGVLITARLLTRWIRPLPPEIHTGISIFDKLARPFHYLLYLVMFGLIISGCMAFGLGGVKQIFVDFQASTGAFSRQAINVHHFLGGTLLPILLALHILAALYHQFIVKNHIFRRMWF